MESVVQRKTTELLHHKYDDAEWESECRCVIHRERRVKKKKKNFFYCEQKKILNEL